jgi:hypothetical protein
VHEVLVSLVTTHLCETKTADKLKCGRDIFVAVS